MNSLHERYVTVASSDGREKRLSALDVSRMENVEFVEFRPPPIDRSDQAAVDAWVDRTNYIIADLRWLLKLQYDRYSLLLYNIFSMVVNFYRLSLFGSFSFNTN